MYLSRIKLDISRRETMLAFAKPSHFHAAIERAADDGNKRKLWRIDKVNGQTYLLILSEDQLDLSILRNQFGFADEETAATVAYDKFIDRVTPNSVWQFRLVANPVHSVAHKENEKRGTVYGHVTVEQQQQWLQKRAEKCGFHLEDGQFAVVGERWQIFKKRDGNKVRLLSVAFEGQLTVVDATLFKQTLCQGLGRGKAYGLGLLTIARR